MNRNAWIMTGIASLEAFAAAMLVFFFPLFFKSQLGLSGAQIGLLYALGSATAFITIAPAGFINDRIQCKRMTALGLSLIFLAYLLLPQVKSFGALLPLFLSLSFGNTVFVLSLESLLHKARETEKRGSYYGNYNGIKSLFIGLGMLTGGMLLSKLTYEAVFRINVFVYGFLILATFLLPASRFGKVAMVEYRKDIFKSSVLVFLFILFMFSLHFGAEVTSYGLFLRENLGLSQWHMGLYMSGELGAMFITAIILGRCVDKYKINVLSIFIVGMLLSGITHITMTSQNFWISFASRAIHGVGDAVMFIFFFISISKFFEKERVGGNSGIASFTLKLGTVVGALIFGPLGASIGYQFPLIYSGLLEILGLVIFLIFLRKKFSFNI